MRAGKERRFNDQDLLHLLDHFENIRRSFEQRLWDTVKYFTTLITAILSVSVGLLSAIGRFNIQSNSTITSPTIFSYKWIAILPSLGLVMTFLGWLNLQREYRWIEEVMSIVIKLRHALGLEEHSFLHHYSQNQKSPFGSDKALMPARLRGNLSSRSAEDWIQGQLRVWKRLRAGKNFKGDMGFYPLFSIVFLVLGTFNVIMIGVLLLSH